MQKLFTHTNLLLIIILVTAIAVGLVFVKNDRRDDGVPNNFPKNQLIPIPSQPQENTDQSKDAKTATPNVTLSGNVEYAQGDCMPPIIPESYIKYTAYTGVVSLIKTSDTQKSVSPPPLQPSNTTNSRTITTEVIKGRYLFKNVPEGEYRVTLPEGYRPAGTDDGIVTIKNTSQTRDIKFFWCTSS